MWGGALKGVALALALSAGALAVPYGPSSTSSEPQAAIWGGDTSKVSKAGKDAQDQVKLAVQLIGEMRTAQSKAAEAGAEVKAFDAKRKELYKTVKSLEDNHVEITSTYHRAATLLQVAHQIARIDFTQWHEIAVKLKRKEALLSHWKKMHKKFLTIQHAIGVQMQWLRRTRENGWKDTQFYMTEAKKHDGYPVAKNMLLHEGGAEAKKAMMNEEQAVELLKDRHTVDFQVKQTAKLVEGFQTEVDALLLKASTLKATAKKSRTTWKMRVRKYQKAYTVWKKLTEDLPKMRKAYKSAYALWIKSKAAEEFCDRRVSESRLALHRALYRSKQDLEAIGDHLGSSSSTSAMTTAQVAQLANIAAAFSTAAGKDDAHKGAFSGV
jgi:hypothetical protein